jgi:hypothetical protein
MTSLAYADSVPRDFYNTVMTGLPERIADIGASFLIDTDDVIKFGKEGGAIFDASEQYRYLLWRVWDTTLPAVMFIGLNPSTANHEKSDPTCTRERRFAIRWGYGAYVKGNLYGYRATKPKDMQAQNDPTGPRNYAYILKALSHPDVLGVIAAWGSNARLTDEMTLWEAWDHHDDSRLEMKCLGTTKHGMPKHPLYISADTEPAPFWCKSRCIDPILLGQLARRPVAQSDTAGLQSDQRSESAH